LLAGALAPQLGAPLTVGLTGVCCLGGAAWFALRMHVLRETEETEEIAGAEEGALQKGGVRR